MEKDKKEKVFSKGFLVILIGVCIVLISLIIIGIMVFSNKDKEVIDEKKHGGNVTLNYSSDIKGLSIVNATPTTNAVGMANSLEEEYFDFSIEVDLDEAKSVEYEVSIEKISADSTISDEDIRIYLEKEKNGTYTKVSEPVKFTPLKEKSELGSKEGSMVLTKNKKIKSETDNYRLRMWLADSSIVSNGNYSVKVNVVGRAK